MNEQELALALNTINECMVVIGKRLEEVEKYVSEMPIHVHDKLLYKPTNHSDY